MKKFTSLFLVIVTLVSVFSLTFTVDVSAATYKRTVKDGKYTLTPLAFPSYRVNVWDGGNYNGCKVTLYKRDSTIDQKIYVKYQGDGKYLLYACCTGNKRVLDIYRGKSKKISQNQKVDTWLPTDLNSQLVYIECIGKNQYIFRMCSNTNLVISANKGSNGSQLILSKYQKGQKKQIFSFYSENGKKAVDPTYKQTAITSGINVKINKYVAPGLRSKVEKLMETYLPGDRKTDKFKSNAFECHGFACDALMMFWNTSKPTASNKKYVYYKATSKIGYVDKIRPGDMVRYRNGNYDHTIVITNIDESNIFYCDCNADGKCTFKYNQKMSKSILENKLKKKLLDPKIASRGYICHYKNNNL